VPDDYTKIQDAINAANYGDTVMVRSGLYAPSTNGERFPILLKNGVSLMSERGPAVTIVDAERSERVFRVRKCDRTTHLRGFTMRGGHTYQTYGGGIYCDSSSLAITENIIRDNRIDSDQAAGGGLTCWGSEPLIVGNTFLGNYAYAEYHDWLCEASGGAIHLITCNSILQRNAFISNTASSYSWEDAHAYGGALDIFDSQVTIAQNTFFGNRAQARATPPGDSYGGAICCRYGSDAVIVNCIFWGDSALHGSEISGSALQVTYSDVHGGWQGTGNIDTAPYFINAPEGVLQLQHSSPCVDAGDPTSLHDPDNTRTDMGAYYFNQSVTPSIELYAHDIPILIPSTGGPVHYDGWVYNLADTAVSVDVWTYAILPDQTRYGPIRQFSALPIRPHARMGMNTVVESVPGIAPAGIYTYVGYVGEFPSTVMDSSYFLFTKSP
jgi:hypothetical protein